jgi:hypothetical protein
MTTRRKFFRLTVFGATAIGLARTGFALPDGYSFLRSAIRERLSYLNIPDEELDRFLKDYLSRLRTSLKLRTCLLGGFSFLLYPLRLIPGFSRFDSLSEFYDSATECFLFSSDFFLAGADSENIVRYVSIYDPYTSACRNPFYSPIPIKDTK